MIRINQESGQLRVIGNKHQTKFVIYYNMGTRNAIHIPRSRSWLANLLLFFKGLGLRRFLYFWKGIISRLMYHIRLCIRIKVCRGEIVTNWSPIREILIKRIHLLWMMMINHLRCRPWNLLVTDHMSKPGYMCGECLNLLFKALILLI